jgi:hypothetical protein
MSFQCNGTAGTAAPGTHPTALSGVRPDDIPEVVAVRRGTNSLVVLRCPYCGKKHYHGLAGGYGGRTADCWPHPDAAMKGYILVEPKRRKG